MSFREVKDCWDETSATSEIHRLIKIWRKEDFVVRKHSLPERISTTIETSFDASICVVLRLSVGDFRLELRDDSALGTQINCWNTVFHS